MTVGNLNIVEMLRTPEGVRSAVDCLVCGGWGTQRQFHPTFSFYADEPHCQVLVAKDASDAVVWTAVAAQHGEVGWLGNIFVTPELRNQGIGEKLTRQAIQRLRDRGCITIRLVATQLGLPLYRRMGFREENEYHELQGTGLGRQSTLPRGARPLLASDVDEAIKFDGMLLGEDRGHLIRRLWPQGWCLTGSDGEIDGLVIPTPWGGVYALLQPQAAPDQGVGFLGLIRSIVGASSELLIYPSSENATARRLLKEVGFTELRTMPRMVLGVARPWAAAGLWSIFSPALG
ncbi:MAG TPA: GNAT family N-acetyltransferase [Candidatus Saccharimonadales bacterium]|nr:GNAT family N-acetyltransferase [Candidatus Saccharimonadales bacterium]